MTVKTLPKPYLPETNWEDEPIRLKMSYEEFLDQIDEHAHAEWVDGEVIIYMPPKNIHQAISGFLHQLLGLFIGLFDLGKILAAPFEVKLKLDSPPGESSSREPDILFIAGENLDRLTEDRLVGPPDLVIEIVSESSVRIDREDKFKEYLDAGVREYWIIDPRPGKQQAGFFRLAARTYQLFATQDDEWIASHVLPGFRLRPTWLWQADTLNPLTCALEIRGVVAALTKQIEQVQAADPAQPEA